MEASAVEGRICCIRVLVLVLEYRYKYPSIVFRRELLSVTPSCSDPGFIALARIGNVLAIVSDRRGP